MRSLLTGSEAIALGFYLNGGSFASGYPGTPSTEIIENLTKYQNEVYTEWAPNEKVAVESAIGASYSGIRSLASMKHVGVNVAADPLATVAYTGVNAGMIIVTADDPGIHSSQNEQDNRNYSRLLKIPMLEPSSSQECLDFIQIAFELSEKLKLPIFIRLTTRICHSKTIVEHSITRTSFQLQIEKSRRFDPIPSISRVLHSNLENKLLQISNLNDSRFFKIEQNSNKIGIITSGMSYNYVKEAFGDKFSVLKLNLLFPITSKVILDFSKAVEQLFIIEELDSFLEEEISKLGVHCIGKELFPKTGELSANIIETCLANPSVPYVSSNDKHSRQANSFCKGCFYNTFFDVLSTYNNIIISSDIGCYSMSGEAPFNAKDIAICMGAGFSIAHGIQKCNNLLSRRERVIGIMGDSTFFHSGITSLISCVYNNSNPILVILDNQSTSMTGLQENPGTGKNLNGEPSSKIELQGLLKALNVENILEFNPFSKQSTQEALNWALEISSLVVLIARGKCILKSNKDKR